ncbi:MAG: HAD-IC family P-type ATPase, partial [Patescibacteria group bacterium]|nr:HAD-IC family P-type ATPase [Patescibacteria group bacterium]
SVVVLNYGKDEREITRFLGTYATLVSDKNATIRSLELFDIDTSAEVVDEIPFTSERKMGLLSIKQGLTVSTYLLGAFDVFVKFVPDEQRLQVEEQFMLNRLEVYRNLLFAQLGNDKSLEIYAQNIQALSLTPICIVSITDEVREDVHEVLRLFEQKGIQFKILSGDSAAAVEAVCREVGWDIDREEVISGNDLDSGEKDRLVQTVASKKIFARLNPEHKLRIIKALRARNLHTVMIGDGVNDLPAIKEADLGIAMEEGSTITKEVADIVLLENKFSLLPAIFEEGNKIINTVSSVAKLTLTKNFMVIYIGILSMLFLFEFPLTPRRVSLITLFAIVFPAAMIALINRNVEPLKNFMTDLFSFVFVSALMIVGLGYIGFFLSLKFLNAGLSDSQMVMLSTMIFLSTVNFLIVGINAKGSSFGAYLGYGIAIVSLYATLVLIQNNALPIRLIKIFYEIGPVGAPSWKIIACVSVLGSLLLFIAQTVRSRMLHRYLGKN